MTTDRDHAAVLRRMGAAPANGQFLVHPEEWAAIERAIELLEREAE